MDKDITHVTIWWFFFVMGGVIGHSTNIFYVFSVGLLLALAGMVVRKFFVDKVDRDAQEEIEFPN